MGQGGGVSPPPTRHVAGGHVGVNLYLSEIVSDILEPLAGTIEGGGKLSPLRIWKQILKT